MGQWEKDFLGKRKRVHKRHWRKGAYLVYFYKISWLYEYGFLGYDVYTAKPKIEGAYPRTYHKGMTP